MGTGSQECGIGSRVGNQHIAGQSTQESTPRGCLRVTRIDDKFVRDIKKPASGQIIHRDDELTGFGVRVTKGSASYIAEGRANGKLKRITICRCGELTPEQARSQARRILEQMAAERGRSSVKAPTLRQVQEQYLIKRRLRESTKVSYRQVVRRHLSDWLDLPVTAITKEMVFDRHRELGKGRSPTYANLIMYTLRAMLYFAAENYEGPDGLPIVTDNPVSRLSKNQMWYRKHRRQGVIPDHKLTEWYRAVMANASPNVRDYLLLMITTGLRRNEAATLRWDDVDFDARTLTASRCCAYQSMRMLPYQ
jgi:Arm DNA-binding domain